MPKIATLCLLVVFFGCDNTPSVRLVLDNSQTFHFQWDEPLKEERIILVRRYGEVGEYVFKGRTSEWKSPGVYYSDRLVYFPVESVVSAPVSVGEKRLREHGRSVRRIHSVELLAAHLRDNEFIVGFPARLYVINDGEFVRHGVRVILREHPFFQEYHIDEPSRLSFTETNE